MRRESHVRFSEGPGVQFPRATRLVVGFQNEADVRRFRDDLDARLRQFRLELHPDKTGLFRFGKNAKLNQLERGLRKPATFDFLGLTHICGTSRAGGFVLVRHTSRKRMRAKLHALREELRVRTHLSIPEQGAWLANVVRGYFAYHAVPTNVRSLGTFRVQATRLWRQALRRRGQRRHVTWERMAQLRERWLPRVRITHPWPEERFDVRTRGRSRVR